MDSVFHHFSSGVLEVIAGPMFSGKTEELIRRVRRAQIGHLRVQVFRPIIDNRYDKNDVVSHSAQSVKAIPLERSVDIWRHLLDTTRVVAIDEVQFFDDEIVSIINKLVRRGLRVICSGLDLDYRGVPFGPMPTLLAMAESVMKVYAICTICGKPATKTQRLVKSDRQILVGATEAYEARCRSHHESADLFEDQELNFHPEEIQMEIFPTPQ